MKRSKVGSKSKSNMISTKTLGAKGIVILSCLSLFMIPAISQAITPVTPITPTPPTVPPTLTPITPITPPTPIIPPPITPITPITPVTPTATAYPTFDNWRTLNFNTAQLTDSSVSGEFADPDKDGIPNILEYAFSLNPNKADISKMPVPVLNANGTQSITFSFLTSATDLSYIVEVSNDNVIWNSGTAYTSTTQVGGDAVARLLKATSLSVAKYMRLRVVPAYGSQFLQKLAAQSNAPTTLLNNSVIPSGVMSGAVTLTPMLYGYPNYVTRWYFSNVGLINFVNLPSCNTLIKNYMNLYISRMAANFTIRDVDTFVPSLAVWQTYPADADDANAGTLLRLASAYQLANPTDPWFKTNLPMLKKIAYYNILLQVKANGLVSVFQGGVSAANSNGVVIKNNTGYLEDNVEAWADLAALVAAQQSVNDLSTEIAYYAAFRDGILNAIHTQLWDNTKGAWKWADTNATATANAYYPDLQCQIFPELYNMPHPSGAAETARRYNLAWAWLSAYKPNWFNAAGWGAADVYSDMSLAVVAMKRGNWSQAVSYMNFALQNWVPTKTSPRGTIISEIGYWQLLTNP